MNDCEHKRTALDPMGGEWCQDCGAVQPPYTNWLAVLRGGKPNTETPVDWELPRKVK